IKPNNILISNRDEALLSDFGLSKLINNNGRATPDTGYFFHIPPEYFTLTAAQFNLTYDIYQAGLTIYRMCVGHIAFENERSQYLTEDQLKNAICDGTFPSKNYPSHIPKKLKSIVNRCLEIDPNDRYQSTLDVLNDLSDISDGALDWRYQTVTSANQHEWHKVDKDVIVSIVFDASTASTTGKRIYPDNSVRRVTALSLPSGCTPAKLYKLLKDN
ncbi:TPA: protein kinase, partial [Escherichia coli]|nr:protein kinase [Escherichia coli]